jgi:hypothetical protein
MLAHEAVHVKQDICDRIGEEKISSEMEAYIVQAVAQNLMDSYKNLRIQET